MKTNSFGKTLFFALMISASGMFVSCAGGEGTEETPATDTTAVAPVTPEAAPVEEPVTTTPDSAAQVNGDTTATTPQ